MNKITKKDIREAVDGWNKAHPEIPMTYSISLEYFGIGFLTEHGGMETFISGCTAREAWEKFCSWKNGYYSYERFNGKKQ